MICGTIELGVYACSKLWFFNVLDVIMFGYCSDSSVPDLSLSLLLSYERKGYRTVTIFDANRVSGGKEKTVRIFPRNKGDTCSLSPLH